MQHLYLFYPFQILIHQMDVDLARNARTSFVRRGVHTWMAQGSSVAPRVEMLGPAIHGTVCDSIPIWKVHPRLPRGSDI
jgi:hypothetical protein